MIYTEDAEPAYLATDEPEPEEDDAFIFSRGQLGAETHASYAGKYLGQFADEDAARVALLAEMSRQDYYPNIWQVSDHGNHHLIVDPMS